jgi:3-oxoisoapionate decarboxylase
MRLGIGSYALAWAIGVPGYSPRRPLSLPEFLERCAALGVGVAQIADNFPLDHLSEAELGLLRGLAADLGLDLEIGARGFGLPLLRRYLDIARFLRSDLLRVVVDSPDHEPTEDEIVSTARRLLPDLDRAGVRLAIENHDRFRARELRRIVERLATDRVGTCLDTVNSFGALEGPEVVVECLGPHVLNLHVKDFEIRRADHKMGFVLTGAPAGRGSLNVPWLLERIRSFGRDPNVILELWPPPRGDVEETIALEASWLESSIRYLRTLIPC